MGRTERKPMPVSERAKQFMPFSALHGLSEALRAEEEKRELFVRPEPAEDLQEAINTVLLGLLPGDRVRAVIYRAGRNLTFCGTVKKTDPQKQYLYLTEDAILLRDLLSLEKI